jgi:hypothetical protein
LKKDLRWGLFKGLPQLQTKVDQLVAELTDATVASVTGYNFILSLFHCRNSFELRSQTISIPEFPTPYTA